MLQYTCDWCKRQKKPGENWILGFAAEKSYSAGYRREVSFASRWTEEWALHALAVHFCSEEHKNNYVEVLIGARLLRQRSQKLRPASAGAAAPTATAADVAQAPSTGRRRSTRRRVERLAPEFTEADFVRAHALGVYLPQSGGREQGKERSRKGAGAKRQHSPTIAGKPRRVQ